MKLDAVIAQARDLLARDGNDFNWSGWEDRDEALAELDRCYADLLADAPDAALNLSVLFAVTGPICETAASSGWGTAYVKLGSDFDTALSSWNRSRR